VPQLKTAFNNTSVPRPAVTAVVPVILDMLILLFSTVLQALDSAWRHKRQLCCRQ